MEYFVAAIFLSFLAILAVTIYRAIKIGNRTHQSVDKWLKSKP